jgi:hypothetical protein
LPAAFLLRPGQRERELLAIEAWKAEEGFDLL